MRTPLPITRGQQFFRLTALRHIQAGNKWECSCSCGTVTIVYAKCLLGGHTKSCGCLQRERAAETQETHGESRRRGLRNATSEYSIWGKMKHRCVNPNAQDYHRYGGRGIKVCERWLNSFANFLEDMGRKPTPAHTIDRFPDKNGDYTPDNCRWATYKEQANNTRRNRVIIANGISKNLAQWSEATGIHAQTISSRLDSGASPEDALKPRAAFLAR